MKLFFKDLWNARKVQYTQIKYWYTNVMKDKDLTVMSMDFKKKHWIKFQHPFMIKMLNKLSRNMLQCSQSHLSNANR